MRIAIVGLPRSGKTTLFNALTGLDAPVDAFAGPEPRANIGSVPIDDPRLPKLAALFGSARNVQAEATIVDAPGAASDGRSSGLFGGEVMNDIQDADALLIVARAFEDPSNPHPEGSVDAVRDAESVLIELALADAGVVRRRIGRIEEGMKGARAAERDALTGELELLARLSDALNAGIPISLIALSEADRAAIRGFQLLTAKPMMLAANLGEDDIEEAHELTARLASIEAFSEAQNSALCGQLEMELAQMAPEEESEFRQSLGLREPASEIVTGMMKKALNIATFFTGNEREARAWQVVHGTSALAAAGTIHSDFERGFIRAEVIGFDDFVNCGSLPEARRRGLLRQEGRSYVVSDGDVMNVLFSV